MATAPKAPPAPIIIKQDPPIEIVDGKFESVSPEHQKGVIRRVDRELDEISKPLYGVQIDANKDLSVPNRAETIPEPPLAQTVRALPALTGHNPTIITRVTDEDKDYLKKQYALLELHARDRYAVEVLANGDKKWISEHCPEVLDRIAETMDKISDCRKLYDKLKMNGVNSAEDVAFMMKWEEYQQKFPLSFIEFSTVYPNTSLNVAKAKPELGRGYERGFYNMNKRLNKEFNRWLAESTLMSEAGRTPTSAPSPLFGSLKDFGKERTDMYNFHADKTVNAGTWAQEHGAWKAARDAAASTTAKSYLDWAAEWLGLGVKNEKKDSAGAVVKNPQVNVRGY